MTEDVDHALRLLRETLRERSADVHSAAPRLPAAPRAGRASAARPVLVAAAAAAVAGLAVAGVANVRATSPAPPPTRPTAVWADATPGVAATTARPRGVPAGWKPVAALGVELFVPAAWRVMGTMGAGCEGMDPAAHVVSRPVGAARASLCGPTRGTVVWFLPGPPGGEVTTGSTRPGPTTITWVHPARTAHVLASGPDRALLQRVLDTARTVDVDALGCGTRAVPRQWGHEPTALPPVRLAAGVTDVVVCVYGGGPWASDDLLVASGRLDAAQRATLARALEEAPTAPPPNPRMRCLPGGSRETYALLRLRSDAGVSELRVHWTCSGRYTASADARSLTTLALVKAVLGPLHIGFGY